ncbi:c-type cytochrome [Sphingomonas sp. KR3-1]|uniref:c-type cytochrome n=1 Tax=Sphingomonas sp. KR3-1 TaxID=3156611 RepID=UPI0032B5BE0D
MRVAPPLLLLGAGALLCATAPGRPGDGLEHGRAVYAARCAACHGRALEGVDEMPALVGARFQAKWRGREAALAAKVRLSMPQDDPGSLAPADAAEVATLVLAANHLPAPPPMRSR